MGIYYILSWSIVFDYSLTVVPTNEYFISGSHYMLIYVLILFINRFIIIKILNAKIIILLYYVINLKFKYSNILTFWNLYFLSYVNKIIDFLVIKFDVIYYLWILTFKFRKPRLKISHFTFRNSLINYLPTFLN